MASTRMMTEQHSCLHRSKLLYADSSNHVDAEYRSLESERVAKLRRCSSVDQIYSLLTDTNISEMSDNIQLLDDSSRKVLMNEMLNSATPNIAAAALRRLTQLTSSKRHQHHEAAAWALVDHLENNILLNTRHEPILTRYALLDVLSSLASLEKKRDVTQNENAKRIRELVSALVQTIHDNRESILETSPEELVNTLYSLHVLRFGTSGHSDTQRFASSIATEICQKLIQGYYLGKLTPSDMSIVLTTLSAKNRPLQSEEANLAISLMRRFRKQAVRQSSSSLHLLRALHSVAKIGVRRSENEHATDQTRKIATEANLMAYTTFKGILQSESVADKSSPSLKLLHISNMLSSVSSLHLLKDEDASLRKLWQSFLQKQSTDLLTCVSVDELARFVRTVEASKSSDLALPSWMMVRVGERFLEATRNSNGKESSNVPEAANTILRCAALEWGHNATVMKPFQLVSCLLFTDGQFLARSEAPYLTNYMSFLDKSKYNLHELANMITAKDDPLVTVADRILKQDVSDSVTPAQASRILSSFTSVLTTRSSNRESGVDDFNASTASENTIIMQLFHNLGGHLLTSSQEELSPRDISSALCAYAKASYALDMGIFDHLAESLASRISECTVRQATQSLWACGKMAAWELQSEEQDEDVDTTNAQSQAPPYLSSASEFANFLSLNQREMTSKDVAQTIWALGRLDSVNSGDYDFSLKVGAFLPRARELTPQLTSPEIANILWGISQTGWRDCRSSVESFTERLIELHHSPSGRISPWEAATAMLALGRMQIVNEELFEALSDDILEQLDTTSAQAIANALWAYRSLHVSPPAKLLDCWAIERLGLSPATIATPGDFDN